MQSIARRELVAAISAGAGLATYSRPARATTQSTAPVSPTAYGAATSAADNTAALNAWLAALGATSQTGIIDGQYNFQGALSVANVPHIRIVQPLAGRFAATEVPYGLVYTGPQNTSGVALQFTGVDVVELDHVTIDGNQNIGTVVDVEPGSTSPGGYQHIGCIFRGCSPQNGICYHIGGTDLCNQFYWQNCFFIPNNSGGVGLQIDNDNSVNHTMIGGSAGAGNTGIKLNRGKLHLIGVEFANNTAQDIMNTGGFGLEIDNCWSEASNRFLYLGFTGSGTPNGSPAIAATTIRNTNVASTPYNYYARGIGPAVNQADVSSYAGILCNRAWGLTLIGCTLVTAGTSPTNPNQMTTVYCQLPASSFGSNVQFDWTNINSYSAIPGTVSPNWSKQFFSLQGTIFG